MEQKSNRREFAHTKELLGDGRASEQLTLAEISRNLHSLQLSRDLQQFLFFVNYGYAHISLLCFPLVMLSASHWLLPQARIQPRPQVKVIFRYLRPDTFVSTSTVFTAPVGMVTFRQSPCWYYPWADAVVSTSTDTQHLWTWWHFGDHAGLINLSVNNIHRIQTRRLR